MIKTPGRKNSTISYFTLKSVIKTAFQDPLIAKFLKPGVLPVELPNKKLENINNAPIYSSNSFTTLTISFHYSEVFRKQPVFVGDLTKKSSQNPTELSGIIKRIYVVPSDSNIYIDLQPIRPITTFNHPLPENFVAHPNEYVLANEIMEKIVLNEQFAVQTFNLDIPKEGEVLIRKKIVKIGERYCLKNFSGTVSSARNDLLHQLRKNLTESQKKKLVVIFIEVSKDEFVSFRTRAYLVDTVNWIFRDVQ